MYDTPDTPDSQLSKDLCTQGMLVREIEDRVELLTRRIKPLLLNLKPAEKNEAPGPAPETLRSAFGQGVADQNDRLRAISQQLVRLAIEIDL